MKNVVLLILIFIFCFSCTDKEEPEEEPRAKNVLEKLSSAGEFISFSFDVDKYFSEKGPEVLKAQSFGPGTFFTDQYASGQVLRVYYTFSAEDALNFYKGHGDILICRDEDKVEDCYPY